MSREQLRRRFCGLTCPNPEDHGIKPWMCETATDEIERLLAQEREKVREMCVATLRNLRRLLKDISSEGGETFRVCGEQAGALYKAEKEIRQLDLTKPESDLAPSSREERIKEKT